MNSTVLEAIARRSSIRQYTAEPVTREQLLVLLKAAMAAPSAMNKQPWEFVAIDDKATMDALADVLPYAKMLHQAGGAIVVCADTTKCCAAPGESLRIQDCAAATQNVLLAAEAIDLGAVWTAVYPNPALVQSVQKILGMENPITPFCVIPIGHPATASSPKDKFDANRIHWNRY